MKKMNKLMAMALAAVAVFGMNSCSKTQFQAGNLVGTWNMTKEVVTETYVSEMPENVGTFFPTKEESSSELTYTPNGLTGTSETTSTYDASFTGGLSSSSEEIEFEADKVTYTETDIVSGVSTSDIVEADVVTTKSYSITFNKDKTFSLTDNSKTVSESNFTDVGYTEKIVETEEEKMTASGSWAYIGADKNAEEKSKERIGLWFTNSTSNNSDETIDTFNDTDDMDGFDYTEWNESYSSENESSSTGTSTAPDMVWKMIEGSKDEMTVTYMYDSKYEGENTSSYTDNTGTTATTSKSENTSSTISTISFSK